MYACTITFGTIAVFSSYYYSPVLITSYFLYSSSVLYLVTLSHSNVYGVAEPNVF